MVPEIWTKWGTWSALQYWLVHLWNLHRVWAHYRLKWLLGWSVCSLRPESLLVTFPSFLVWLSFAVKPVLSGHSKIDKTKVLKTNGSLMKVESIAECSLRMLSWSILQYFWPALSDNQSWKPILVFFLSGHLRQILLYSIILIMVPCNMNTRKCIA